MPPPFELYLHCWISWRLESFLWPVHPCAKVMALFFKMWKFANFDFFKFLENLGVSNRSVDKHLSEISLKSTIALSTHWSLNPEASWFFDFKLEPTMCVTEQSMQWYWYCPKMPRTTIRQRWSVTAPDRTGMRAPAILRRIGIPRRAVYGVLSRHAVRPNEVTDIPRSGRPHKAMGPQWLQTGLSWHYGGLTPQKYTDHILGPHKEPHIDNHALADIVAFKPG